MILPRRTCAEEGQEINDPQAHGTVRMFQREVTCREFCAGVFEGTSCLAAASCTALLLRLPHGSSLKGRFHLSQATCIAAKVYERS